MPSRISPFRKLMPCASPGAIGPPFNFLSPFLTNAYRRLRKGSLAKVATVPLGKIADVGPEGRRIRDAYTQL